MKRARLRGVSVMLVATATSACANGGLHANPTPLADPANQPRTAVATKPATATRGESGSLKSPASNAKGLKGMAISNESVAEHPFLADMYVADDYYPKPLVDKGKAILLRLCERIERDRPKDTAALYVLTHAATEEFNRLDDEFVANGSEIETTAREAIAADFEWIAKAYGFDADTEELISTRDW
jgi:hypothetical protein